MTHSYEFFELDTDCPNTFGFRVHGTLTTEAMHAFIERLEAIEASGNKARCYLDLVHYEGFELGVIREKISHVKTLWHAIDRVAYVIDRSWMTAAVNLLDAFTPMHIRAFDHSQTAEATAWVLKGDEAVAAA